MDDGLEPQGCSQHGLLLVVHFDSEIPADTPRQNVAREFGERQCSLSLDRLEVGKLHTNVILDEGVIILGVEKIEGHGVPNWLDPIRFPDFRELSVFNSKGVWRVRSCRKGPHHLNPS